MTDNTKLFQLADEPDDVRELDGRQVATWRKARSFFGTVVTLNSGAVLRLSVPFREFHHWVCDAPR